MSELSKGRSGAPGLSARLWSIGWKLGVLVVAVVTTAMAVAFFHFTAREKDGLIDAKEQAAEMVADLFAASLRAPLDFGDEDAIRSELENLRQNRDVTTAVVSETVVMPKIMTMTATSFENGVCGMTSP